MASGTLVGLGVPLMSRRWLNNLHRGLCGVGNIA